MATTTFPDPQVTAIADQYLWVKLDADEETALAARWRVHGLPHTLVLDAQERVLGSQPGYMTPAALVQFLAESQANPQPLDGVPQAGLDGLADLQSAADAPAIVKQAVEQLSRAEPEGRALLLEALQDAQPGVRVHLAALLQDERLAVRATACGVLQRSVRGGPPFDPFAAADVRAEQARQWAELAAKSTTAP